jgi:GT2 family glycosyltransferase
MKPRCSIVVPVHNRRGLSSRCLEAILGEPPDVPFEIVVVDDASTDGTPELLARHYEDVRIVARARQGGFAAACNDGVSAATGDYLVFLNNDTVAQPGWLDALVDHAGTDPAAAVVGAKLLFPNDTIQHAGVVISADGWPRHIYAGFRSGHPAVNRSRRYQAVTAACALVRRDAFERVGGFDLGYRNSLEDVDLCLRLGELGYEVRYCAESVLYHLESASRGRDRKRFQRSASLYSSRWRDRVRADDVDYYLADGLLRVEYDDLCPLRIQVSEELAIVDRPEGLDKEAAILEDRTRQVVELLQESVRLTARLADLEVQAPAPPEPARAVAALEHEIAGGSDLSRSDLSRGIEDAEVALYEAEARIADRAAANSGVPRVEPFVPSPGLAYRRHLRDVCHAVEASVPAGAQVLVISRGDAQLLRFSGRDGRHFPQGPDGRYSGYHPRDSGAAIRELEELRVAGCEYLVIPSSELWWLVHYEELADHLERRYEAVVAEEDICLIYRLTNGAAAGAA